MSLYLSSLGLGQSCLCRTKGGHRILQISLGLKHSSLEQRRIDLRDYLALGHMGVEVHIELLDGSRHLRSDLDGSNRRDAACSLDNVLNVALLHLLGVILG